MKVNNVTPLLFRGGMEKQSIEEKKSGDFGRHLEQALQDGDNKKLHTACQELESVFISKVLESMRATIPRSDFMGRSLAIDTFESMLYDEYARSMSQTGSLGIADMVYRQMVSKL
jgi:flagellar protein FlgJ